MIESLCFDDMRRLLPSLKLPTADGNSVELSAAHVRALNREGIAHDKFTDQAARLLLIHLAQRREEGLCTMRQAAALEKFDVHNPAQVLFTEVDAQLAEARERMLPVRINKYLEKCEPAVSGQHGHTTTFLVALALIQGFALGEGEALPYLRQYNQRCQPPWSDDELKHKLAGAAAGKPSERDSRPRGYLLGEDELPVSIETSPAPGTVREPKPPAWPLPDLDRINAIVTGGPGLYDLWEQSPVRFEDDENHAEEIIDLIFPGNPWLCIGKAKDDFYTWRRECWPGGVIRKARRAGASTP